MILGYLYTLLLFLTAFPYSSWEVDFSTGIWKYKDIKTKHHKSCPKNPTLNNNHGVSPESGAQDFISGSGEGRGCISCI